MYGNNRRCSSHARPARLAGSKRRQISTYTSVNEQPGWVPTAPRRTASGSCTPAYPSTAGSDGVPRGQLGDQRAGRARLDLHQRAGSGASAAISRSVAASRLVPVSVGAYCSTTGTGSIALSTARTCCDQAPPRRRQEVRRQQVDQVGAGVHHVAAPGAPPAGWRGPARRRSRRRPAASRVCGQQDLGQLRSARPRTACGTPTRSPGTSCCSRRSTARTARPARTPRRRSHRPP